MNDCLHSSNTSIVNCLQTKIVRHVELLWREGRWRGGKGEEGEEGDGGKEGRRWIGGKERREKRRREQESCDYITIAITCRTE